MMINFIMSGAVGVIALLVHWQYRKDGRGVDRIFRWLFLGCSVAYLANGLINL